MADLVAERRESAKNRFEEAEDEHTAEAASSAAATSVPREYDTTRADVEAYLIEALAKLREQGFRPPPPNMWWQKTLSNNLVVQVGHRGDRQVIGQLFPVAGPSEGRYKIESAPLGEVQEDGYCLAECEAAVPQPGAGAGLSRTGRNATLKTLAQFAVRWRA